MKKLKALEVILNNTVFPKDFRRSYKLDRVVSNVMGDYVSESEATKTKQCYLFLVKKKTRLKKTMYKVYKLTCEFKENNWTCSKKTLK